MIPPINMLALIRSPMIIPEPMLSSETPNPRPTRAENAFTASLPLEVFWQRPRRVAAAKVDLERVAESLVQTGLNLVRDVRVAHAELTLADDRARVASESLRQRTEVAQIVEAKLRLGDISELETGAARLDARQAEELAARTNSEAKLAKDRLRFLLGMGASDTTFATTWPVRS